ncbi:MAG: DUF58 domain-containing protein, partial [Spirulina sp. SIO3F2]|nr:DUF58 domain-containing protein [Spirulina sp. SIO3F2]
CCQLGVQLWTADRGLVKGNQVVLETLAAVQIQADAIAAFPLDAPSLCLTAQASRLKQLPPHSRYLLFSAASVSIAEIQGFQIDSDRPLAAQLAQAVR